jgi:hypothetical protein
MEDCAREEAVASQESREAAAVAQLLAQEEIPAAEARVAEAQAQLEGLQLQVATFEKEAVTKSEVAEGLRTRAGMVQDTLRGLEQEMVKVQYLVQACSDKNASGWSLWRGSRGWSKDRGEKREFIYIYII